MPGLAASSGFAGGPGPTDADGPSGRSLGRRFRFRRFRRFRGLAARASFFPARIVYTIRPARKTNGSTLETPTIVSVSSTQTSPAFTPASTRNATPQTMVNRRWA